GVFVQFSYSYSVGPSSAGCVPVPVLPSSSTRSSRRWASRSNAVNCRSRARGTTTLGPARRCCAAVIAASRSLWPSWGRLSPPAQSPAAIALPLYLREKPALHADLVHNGLADALGQVVDGLAVSERATADVDGVGE